MPNRRGTTVEPADLETAHPFAPGRFSEPESQEQRGLPGSRDRGTAIPDRPRDEGKRDSAKHRGPAEWSGVNPLPPIDPAMPIMKPGDQAG